ncbi:hypothetical protein [Cohaesibacter gelatinilyticus]|nr:hypothetical protein [Cohaesibacter gelatinilyticus]
MLRALLLVNSASCAVFGGLFLAYPVGSAAFIGTIPPIIVTSLGALLAINAILLVLTAWRWYAQPKAVAFFILGDASWVLGTLALLASNFWIQGTAAIWSSLIVAIMVGTLGYGQYHFGLRKKQVRQLIEQPESTGLP